MYDVLNFDFVMYLFSSCCCLGQYSPPIRKTQVRTEGSRGEKHVLTNHSIQYFRNSLNVARVGCVFRAHYVYLFR